VAFLFLFCFLVFLLFFVALTQNRNAVARPGAKTALSHEISATEAPTRSHLQSEYERMIPHGCTRSLHWLLRSARAPVVERGIATIDTAMRVCS